MREAEALQQIAAVNFVGAVQTALREVEDALVTHAKAGQTLSLRAIHLQTLREQRQLTQRRFDGGYGNYFDVLEADRRLMAAELQQAEAQRAQFVSLVAIYKSMGGGWALPEVTALRAPPPKITE